MAYAAKVLLDSVSPAGARLTTMEITYPRFVHSEFMTHRMFSRNAASSRAIPIGKMIERVMTDPVMPVWWGKNQSGMQAPTQLSSPSLEYARAEWLNARDHAVRHVQNLSDLALHKQVANRILEPWMWITVIVSATEWENFFALRCHPDAQPELRKIAEMMEDLYRESEPVQRAWHLPLVDGNDLMDLHQAGYSLPVLTKISVGRCARVSYLTHDGKRDPVADVELHERLKTSGHWSPFEHVAEAQALPPSWSGNFYGWNQYRKSFSGENRGPA